MEHQNRSAHGPSVGRRTVDQIDLTVTIPGELRRVVADPLTASAIGERVAGRTRTARPERLRLAAELLDPTAGQRYDSDTGTKGSAA